MYLHTTDQKPEESPSNLILGTAHKAEAQSQKQSGTLEKSVAWSQDVIKPSPYTVKKKFF